MKTRIITAITVLALLLCGCNAEAQENEAAGQSQSSGTVQVQQYAEQNEDETSLYTTESIAMPCAVTEIEMCEAGGIDGRYKHWRVFKDESGKNMLVYENIRMNETKTYELSDDDFNEIMGMDYSEYIGKKYDNGIVYDAVYYSVTIRYEDGTEALSEVNIPALWQKFNHYLNECEPVDAPAVYEPIEGYPHFKYDTVSRITVIPEFQIPMDSKEPLEVPEGIKQDLAKLIEVCEGVPTEKPTEELTGGGYIVTVYNSEGKTIEYNFWNEGIFVVDGIYYSTARAYGENIISAIISVILEAEAAEKVSEIKVDEITPLSKEEDLQIRTDYAAYVSSRHKIDDSGASGTSRLVTADDVHGEFYFGTYDGYMIVVMCPSEAYTADIGRVKLRYTDADIIDPSCDCYPYFDIELPSGMFELLAYKDGAFIPVEKALETKLIDYSVAIIIENYMDAYYQGNRTCAYNVSCWR